MLRRTVQTSIHRRTTSRNKLGRNLSYGKLPKGIQVFEKLIGQKALYVDKTEIVYPILEDEGATHFLARPRRFGKSLLVSTLGAIFRGERDLFRGLWIESSNYSWRPSPVISLDFSDLASASPQALSEALNRHVAQVARRLEVALDLQPTPSETLSLLVELLGKQGDPVILVDEYDAPLVTHLSDPGLMAANRAALSDFFKTFKKLQQYLRMAFITGVTQFSKVSLFSGLNSLNDLSFSPKFSTLLGWTEGEIRHVYGAHIARVADQLGKSMVGHLLSGECGL